MNVGGGTGRWGVALVCGVIAAGSAGLMAQQSGVQSPPVRRTELTGTAAPPAQIFKVFQFPADKIPRIDGDPSDWAMVPFSSASDFWQNVEEDQKS